MRKKDTLEGTVNVQIKPSLTIPCPCATLFDGFSVERFETIIRLLTGERRNNKVMDTKTSGPATYSQGLVKNYIGGKWVEGSTGQTFESRNPATGEVLATLTVSDKGDVNKAVEAAQKAFKSWRLMPAPRRGEILFACAQMLVERKEDLARLMTQEMGKVLAEARGDVQEAIDMTFYMAGEGRRMSGQVVPAELPNKFAMAVRDPIGVVGAITPWNFPIAIPSWKLMPALIAGNTIVFKPASDTPLLAMELVKLLTDAGLPDGVVNVVLGPG